MRLVSESGLEGHTTGSQGRSHARDEACEERLCEKHSPSNLRQARLAKCLKVPILLDLRPFEGVPNNQLLPSGDC